MRPLTAFAEVLVALGAANAGAAGLWEHYQSALTENTAYLEQVEAAARAAEQPRALGSLLLPQVALTGRWTRFGRPQDGGGPGGGNNNTPDRETRTQALSLRQPLFNLQDYLEYRSAHAAGDSSRLRAESARSSLMVQVAEAYFSALWTGQQLDLTRTRLRAVREQLSSITSGVEAGSATLLDQLRVQAELQSVVAEEIAARGDRELALRNLALVSGLDDDSFEQVSARVPAEAGQPRAALRERAREDNLAVRALRADLDATQTMVDAVASSVLPTVDLVAERTRTDGDASAREYDTRVAVEFQWTLYSGGGRRPVHQQALSDLRAADVRLRGQVQAAANETDRAVNLIRNGESRVKALEASVKANEELLDIVTFGYEENVNVLTDVFDAQKDLENSKSLLARARYDLLLDSLRLLDVIGALDDGRFRDFTGAVGG